MLPNLAKMATVVLTHEAREQVERLPAVVHLRVLNVLERLVRWPEVSGAKPLRGNLAGFFRIRTGDYRIQFFAKGSSVRVTKIGHRDGFYDE